MAHQASCARRREGRSNRGPSTPGNATIGPVSPGTTTPVSPLSTPLRGSFSVTRIGRPGVHVPAPTGSVTAAAMRSFHPWSPSGPRRVAANTFTCNAAANASVGRLAIPASTSARAAATTSSQSGSNAALSSGSTSATPSPRARTVNAPSASPRRTASARSAMPEPESKRWTRSRTVTPPSSGCVPTVEACGTESTMSRSTEPTSTLVSWSGSPTNTRCASGRTAARSLAMRGRSIIEASSTTTRSWGSRKFRSMPAGRSGRTPSNRWSVVATLRPPTASVRRDAALPVGAASVTRHGSSLVLSSRSTASRSRPTVHVLPVPGPPTTTLSGRVARPARRCAAGRPVRMRRTPR